MGYTRNHFATDKEYREFREEENKRTKVYRENNRETINKKRMDRYYQNHDEELKKCKRYDDSHKPQKLIYRQKNKLSISVKQKKYRDENSEHVKKQQSKKYFKNPEKYKSMTRQRYQNVVTEFKKIVISHYSKNKMECKLCKVKGLDFLNIDHIEGRKKMGHSRKVKGSTLYHFLIKNDFPEGYQVLCWNCNNIKKFRAPKTLSQTIKAVYSRQRDKRGKIEVMSYYSKGIPHCSCCKYDDLDGLTIDHIEGRKNVEHKRNFTGGKLYHWLIEKKFPSKFQVLCFNCNSAKSDNPECPHKLDRNSMTSRS